MNINDNVPDILGLDQNGEEVKLSSFDTQKFIIYFYPKDSTPGCTAESCSLRDSYGEFQAKGYQIIGVSANDAKSHQRFIAKNSLPFPLVADTEHKLCEQFGVWQLKKLAGREYMGIVRTTFVVENGVVTDIIKKVDTKNANTQLFTLLENRGK
jgi:peroxiredoxin Q/BCP